MQKEETMSWVQRCIGLSLGSVLAAGLLAGGWPMVLISHAQSDAVMAPVPSNLLSDSESLRLVSADSVKQGQVLHIRFPLTADVAKVSMAGKTVPVYPNGTEARLALVPIEVDQKLGGYTLTALSAAGKTVAEKKVEVISGGYSRQNITLSGGMGGIQPSPGELAAIGRLKTDTDPSHQWWQLPFTKPVSDCMNSPFGNLRYHNGKFTGNYHKGLDQRSPSGRPIHAITGGTVKIAQRFNLHGGTVGLDHGRGVSSVYIHMSKILVSPGQQVKQGDVIGHVGSTGFATGPHLHWGLYVNGQPVDPQQFVSIPRC